MLYDRRVACDDTIACSRGWQPRFAGPIRCPKRCCPYGASPAWAWCLRKRRSALERGVLRTTP